MHRKAFTALLGATALTLALGACSDTANDPASSASGGTGKQPYVALISKGFRHQFWQAVKAGAEQAGKEFNVKVTFEGAQEEGNVEQQIQLLQTVIDKHPDAIGFAAIDSQAAGPLMQQAKSAKIPVIAFDSGVDSDVPITTASTDNLAAAAEAAKHMADKIGHEGKIAMVVHDQTSVTGVQRRDGFVDYLKKNEPKIQIVDTQYSGDPQKATDIAKAILTAHPDLKGIYGSNEGAAIGVLHAVQEKGLTGKITVVGFDSGKDQIDAIKAGTMAGAITQNPVGIGYETVKAAVAVIKGQKVEKNIDTGYYWYDKTNIDDPKIAAVLYQ
jgi:ribose transport system substrate-binding protein